MPKSKRNKQVELSRTKKHGIEGKKKLYEEIRSCVESYAHVFIFSVNDMRNSKIKSVREQWRHSRFFIGKNKVMALALGRSPEEEFRKNLHKIGECLKGERGLIFSNQSTEEVLKWFKSYSEGDYARSGNRATETVVLPEGPLSQFPHNLEPYLRQLGLPTTLKKGVIHLIQDHTVCNEGDILTPETAKILKLLGYEMAEFYIKIECVWSQDGTFTNLAPESEFKENVNNVNSNTVENSKEIVNEEDIMDVQEMEVTDPDDAERNSVEKTENQHVDDEDEEIPDLVEDVESTDITKKDNSESMKDVHDDANVEDEHSAEENINSIGIDSDEELSSEKCEEDNTSTLVNGNIQSPLVREQRPKYSPKLTRSAARASTKKIIKGKSTEKVQHEEIAELDFEEKNIQNTTTGESPAERKLRNRSIKIVKKK